MRVYILRSFPHSRDGVTILEAVAGTEDEIVSSLVAGLELAGFIKRLIIDPQPVAAPAPPMAPKVPEKKDGRVRNARR
jgi:hypothetical protein